MRTIVVTGAASGIGRATLRLLEQRGDRVIGVDTHDAELEADLRTPEGRATMIDQVRYRRSMIDGVVANAGVAHQSPDDVAVNFFGAVATLERLLPLLARSRAPRAARPRRLHLVERPHGPLSRPGTGPRSRRQEPGGPAPEGTVHGNVVTGSRNRSGAPPGGTS